MKSRVGSYRRVFVYTHRNMPHLPVVILHCALTGDPSDNVEVCIISHEYYCLHVVCCADIVEEDCSDEPVALNNIVENQWLYRTLLLWK